MQSLNSLLELNTRTTRSCRLGIALASWAKLNIVKLAPAHTGGCFGLTLSRENALTKWNQELRALPRSLCEHQRSIIIRRVPTKKKRGQRRMTGAAHTVECHQRLRANVPNERRKNKTKCTNKINVVYTDGWCKIYADSLSPHSRRQVDSTACVIRSLLALNSE